jgi:phosphopantothenoylcysteine synthetase/decarboxylase
LVSFDKGSATGFESDENEVLLVTRTESIAVERAPKSAIAQRILDQIPNLRLALHARS